LELHALSLVCGLAAVALAPGALDRAGLGAMLAGFIVVLLAVSTERFPQPASIGALAAVACGYALYKPQATRILATAAGVFGGLWVSVLAGQGLPFLAALPSAVAVLGASVWLAARRADFAPARLREEAWLIVGMFGLLLAVGPAVVEGWRSARAFAGAPLAGESSVQSLWLPAFVAGCLVVGGLYSVWKRR